MHSTATKGQFGIALHTPQQWLSYEQNTFREGFTVVKRMFAEQGPRYVLGGIVGEDSESGGPFWVYLRIVSGVRGARGRRG